ncbi:MAG: radical SAM family heme chaperone HemW [Candidatus Eremiobacteraeota bacterium]|nr:radical SAM family heme chaperone HemW [Candidatus Eremiobacteraeota bacterium]
MSVVLGLYVHLPFCPYICPYCDFAKWPHKRSRARQYLTALYREIENESMGRAESIFFGGGTPNTYEAAELCELITCLKERFPSRLEHEITIEMNPDLAHATDFAAYRAAGVNRLSIGVQSFNDAEIATLGRRHSAADIVRVVSQARVAAIPSLSLDLIFAVPGQTPQSWSQTLRTAIGLEVDHISTYGLTVEEGTPYASWQQREPGAFFDDSQEADFYQEAITQLEAAGYEQYEISNFARPGHRSIHNANYWDNGQYLGFGVGAASYRDGVRSVHTRSLDEYISALDAGRPIPTQSEQLQGAARAGEAVMLALRTEQGVGFKRFKERYAIDFLTFYQPVVERLCRDGLLDVDETRAALTKRGRFVANDVCGAFLAS